MIMTVCMAFLLMWTPTSAMFPAITQSLSVSTQEDRDFSEGRQALTAGDYQTAIASFSRYTERKPKEFNGHYYLGLSHRGAKQFTQAITAFERAAKADSKRYVAYYEIGATYLTMKDYSAALKQIEWLREKDAAFAEYLYDLVPQEMIEQYHLPPTPTATILAHKSIDGQEVLPMKAELKPVILYKEKASYTEMARLNRIQGTIVLGLIFSKNGEITDLKIIRGLPDGLTLNALKAAQNIRFKPALKDGQPVSVRGTIEFSFTLY